MKRKIALVLIVASWLTTIGLASFFWMKYEFSPETKASIQTNWPKSTCVDPAADRMTLLLFAHPQCPCTRASLEELKFLLQKHASSLKSYVLFFEPSSVNDSWRNSKLWKQASSIAELTILPDKDGKEATKFGAATSGQTLLFSSDGRLLYSGGITMSRGQVGDNPGLKSLVSAIDGASVGSRKNLVFGCSLF